MRFIIIFTLLLLSSLTFAQVPTVYQPRGVGGGGAFYSPCIDPTSSARFYVSSDMTGVYYTATQGTNYKMIPHTQLQGGAFSVVRFTNITGLRYAINYKMAGNLAQYSLAKTVDTGSTWTNIVSNLDPSSQLYSLFVDYNTPAHILLSDYSNVYYSSNGGVSFRTIYTTANMSSGCIVSCAMFNGSAIYIGTSDGLLASTDNGANFSMETHTGIPANERIMSFCMGKVSGIIRMFCLTGNINNVYVGMNTSGQDYYNTAKGVYKLDYSATAAWAPINTGLNFTSDFPMYIACAENDNNYCWLAGCGTTGEPRVWCTTNAGTSWTSVFKTTNNLNIIPGWSGSGGERNWTYGGCVLGLAVSPRDKYTAIITDLGFIHRTADAGGNWRQAYVPLDNTHVANAAVPLGFAYSSIGLENTTCWQVWWLNMQNMFAGYSDIKGIRSTDSGTTWSFDYRGLATSNSIYRFDKSSNGAVTYAATSGIHDMYQSTRLQDAQLDAADPSGAIYFSTNLGANWTEMHNFGHPVFWIAVDPNNATDRMYASVIHSTQGGVYMTNNRSAGANATWTKLPNPPRTEGHPASLVVLSDGQLLATYSARRTAAGAFTPSSGCFLYNPATSTWTDKSDNGMKYWCKDVVVDPNDPTQNTWYVGVFSGWGGAPNGLGGLYKTTNRGTTWTRIWNEDRVTSITFHPQFPNTAYITTEVDGLWITSNINNATPTFSQLTAFPFRQPERVYFNPYVVGEMWVTTFGGGMFKANAAFVTTENIAAFAPSIKVFPNPTANLCTLELPDLANQTAQIQVFNTMGELVERTTTQTNTPTLNTENWASGVYFLDITIENRHFQSRIIKN